MWKKRQWYLISLLLLILILSSLWALSLGAVSISWSKMMSLCFAQDLPAQDLLLKKVLLNIRLPRLLLSVIAGAVLASAGVVMQALFRNPLAEPGLMGVSAGASLGAVCAIVLLGSGFAMVASAAFVGSVLVTLIVYAVGQRFKGVAGLLLAGIAVNASAFSVIGLLTYMASDAQLRDLTFWSMGSLATSSWPLLAFLTPWSIIFLTLMACQWRSLNALLLGEREVVHLGFSLNRLRYQLIIGIALLIGPMIAVTGGIGFVGLVVPHIMRTLLGANHKYLLPASLIGGSLLLVLADLVARTLVIPAELPVGLLTSLLGGPFFLYLLLRVRQL